ncbi:MAG: hypothetical protein JOZ01_03930, partial [Candidatus Eremiobacteraeota bacterium]|nr:hypothetical protein [Candidatus Eremiobacteraeota bacterium]
ARPLADGLLLVRPLLRVSRGSLRAYCVTNRLPFARDASNEDKSIRRNALRAALGPLREAYPRLDEAVARCAEIVRDEGEGSPRAALRDRLRRALTETQDGLRDVTFERIEAAARLIEARGAGKVYIKEGVELVRSG